LRNVLINSFDRDWLVDAERYKYTVRFSSSHRETKTEPIYENNASIPWTRSAATPGGIDNTSGFYYNDVFYSAYDASADPGAQLGTETYEVSVNDSSAHMQSTLKSVKSIRVNALVLPREITGASSTSFTNSFKLNVPYVLLCFEQYQGVTDGSDDAIRRSFAQMTFHESYQTDNGRGYCVMHPMSPDPIDFSPNIVPSVDALTVRIMGPTGELLNDSQDALGVNVFGTDSLYGNMYLQVTTVKSFEENAIYTGDIVRFQGVTLYETSSIASYSSLAAIRDANTWLNREAGHEVMELGEASDTGYYSSFYIRLPGSTGDSGEYQIDTSLSEAVTYFAQDTYEDFVADGTVNGWCLNASLQNVISLTVETLVH